MCHSLRLLITTLLMGTIGLSAVGQDVEVDRLYDPNRILDVQITMDSDDWDHLRLQTRSLMGALKETSDAKSVFEYVKGDVTIDGRLIKNVAIRKKGFLGSLDEDRPSLKIRFDKYEDQSPFGVRDRLTLNNNKQDDSRMSQYLSYKLFNESGTVAPRSNFAKVTVNGRSLGIYSNVEPYESPLLERGFGDGSGPLFEGTVADWVVGRVERFERKTGNAKLDDFRRAAEMLAADQIDLDELGELIDIKAFVRFWAMESLIGFWDGYTHNQNNFFVYQNPASGKYYFMPWGADSAFTYSVPAVIDRIRHRSVHTQSVLGTVS